MYKDDYGRIIRQNAKRAINQKIEFIENLECLNHLSAERINKIVHSFVLTKFQRKAKVYSQGEDANWVYLVRDGEFQISKTQEVIPDKNPK